MEVFMSRLNEWHRAEALKKQIEILQEACKIAPSSAPALEVRIAELRADRLALNPPLATCGGCGAEWDGRQKPPQASNNEGCYGNHDDMEEMWAHIQKSGLQRGADELPEEFSRRMAAWLYS
jgi:hypothetical protein